MIDGVNLTDCKTLEEYCEKKTAEYKAKGWSTIGCNIEFYNDAGVYTLEDAIKWELYGTYSDIHKDARGFRPRFNFLEYTVNELEEMINDVSEEAKEIAEMERREERRAWVNLRKEIIDHAEYFNISLKKALEENIIKADVMYGDTGQVDLGYYCYKRGIPFSKYKVITKVLGQKVEEKYGDKIVNIEV